MEQPTFDTFYTLGGEAEALYKDKGSKFLAYGYPVTCEEEIKGRLDALRKRYFIFCASEKPRSLSATSFA